MEEMYLGIDPSTVASGFAVMSGSGALIDWGVIKPNKKKLDETQQAAYQYQALIEIMSKYNIVGIGCEDQHRGPNADTFKKLSRVSGYIILLAGMFNVPLKLYHPSSWRKIVHGKGNAKKEETLIWANETYELLLRKKDNDIADAMGICRASMLHFTGENINGDSGKEVS